MIRYLHKTAIFFLVGFSLNCSSQSVLLRQQQGSLAGLQLQVFDRIFNQSELTRQLAPVTSCYQIENSEVLTRYYSFPTPAAFSEPDMDSENLNLIKRILSELGALQITAAADLVWPLIKDCRSDIRASAFLTLIQLHRTENFPFFEKRLLAAISQNLAAFDALTPSEIQILGTLTENSALILLQQAQHKPFADHALIIQALGSELFSLRAELPCQGPDCEGDLPQGVTVGDLFSSEKGDDVKKLIDPSNLTSGERLLLDYLRGNTAYELKKLALNSLYTAYAPNSEEKLLKIFHDKNFPLSSRILVLRFLSEKSLETSRTAAVNLAITYRGFYYRYEGEVSLKENLVLQIARLEAKNPVDVLQELRLKLWQEQWKIEAERLKIIQYQQYLQQLRNLKPYYALENLLKQGGIPSDITEKMHHNLIRLAKNRSGGEKPESKLVFSGLKNLYGDMNFFDLKERGEQGLNNQGIFSSIMNQVMQNYTSETLQLQLLQKVWGLSHQNCLSLRNFYLGNQNLIKKINL